MRNWIKRIRHPDKTIADHPIYGVVYPLVNGRLLRASDLRAVGDLQDCKPGTGPFPTETVETALVGDMLYITDPTRGEFHTIQTLPSD